MKKCKKQEIRDLLIQGMLGEISFSQMVEVINEMVSESEVSEFKDGDFVAGLGCVFILHKQIDKYSAQYHVLYAKTNRRLLYRYYKTYSQLGGIDKLRLATEAEKQELLDALAKEGKRWNAEKLCVEDIPAELKKGDLAIFWDFNKEEAFIGIYKQFRMGAIYPHRDYTESGWKNAIKFESKEQFEKLIKEEI